MTSKQLLQDAVGALLHHRPATETSTTSSNSPHHDERSKGTSPHSTAASATARRRTAAAAGVDDQAGRRQPAAAADSAPQHRRMEWGSRARTHSSAQGHPDYRQHLPDRGTRELSGFHHLHEQRPRDPEHRHRSRAFGQSQLSQQASKRQAIHVLFETIQDAEAQQVPAGVRLLQSCGGRQETVAELLVQVAHAAVELMDTEDGDATLTVLAAVNWVVQPGVGEDSIASALQQLVHRAASCCSYDQNRDTWALSQPELLEKFLQAIQLLSFYRSVFPPHPADEMAFTEFAEILLSIVQDTTLPSSVLGAAACVLANLFAHSIPWQEWLRSRPHVRRFYRALVSYLSNPNLLLVVATLNLVARLLLDDPELGQKLFNDDNISQIFELAFSLLTSPADSRQQSAVHMYTVELFSVLMESVRCVTRLGDFHKLNHFVDLITDQLLRSPPHLVGTTARFLRVICAAPQTVDALLAKLTEGDELLDMLLAWLAADSAHNTPYDIRDDAADIVIRMVLRLTGGQSPVLGKIAAFVSSMFNSTIATAQGDGALDLLLVANVSRIATAINRHGAHHISVVLDTSSMLMLHGFCREALADLFVLNGAVTSSHNRSFATTTRDFGSRLVITTFCEYLISLLEAHDHDEAKGYLDNLLHAEGCLVMLSKNLLSTSAVLVESSINILSSRLFKSLHGIRRLSAVVASWNRHASSTSTETTTHGLRHSAVESESGVFSKRTLHHHHDNQQWQQQKRELRQSTGSHVDEDIQRVMHHVKHNLQLRDMRASEIMAMYESRLQEALSKERQLSSLLEAKTSALMQSDKLLSDYQTQQTLLDEECAKLRTLLRESEGRREAFQVELTQQQHVISSLQQERTRTQQDVEDYHALQTAYSELQDKLGGESNAREALEMEVSELKSYTSQMKSQHKSLNEQIRQLKSQNANLQDQIDDVTRSLKAETENTASKTAQLQEFQEQYNELSSKCTVLQSEVSTLKTQLSDKEDEVQQAKDVAAQRKEELETSRRAQQELEATVKDLESQLAQMKEELEKHRQITNMIHNLSKS